MIALLLLGALALASPGFVVVHADPPDEAAPATARAEVYLGALDDFVDAAAARGHQVSVGMSTGWAEHINHPACMLDGEACRVQVYGWQVELGADVHVHHHAYGQAEVWDRYSNAPLAATEPVYLGPVADLWSSVAAVRLGGASAIVAASTIEYPPTHSVRFSTIGGLQAYTSPVDGDLVSQPCARLGSDGSTWTWELRHRRLTPDTLTEVAGVELPAAAADLALRQGGPYALGFVLHASDYAADPSAYVAWFDALEAHGVQLQALPAVVAAYPYTLQPAAEARQRCAL